MINLDKLIEELNTTFNGKLRVTEDGQAVFAGKDNIRSLLKKLKENYTYKMLIDITAVDYSEYFEVIYHLMALENAEMIRLKIKVPADEPQVPSVMMIWKAADVLEREIYDLMGIDFEGHTNLKRILCPDDFIGHALRKDFKVEAAVRS